MPKDHPQTTDSILCPECGYACSPKAIVCRSCGTPLRALSEDTSKTAIMPRPRVDHPIDEDISNAGGTSRFSEGSVLYISVERVNSPITRYVHQEPIVLGRQDTNMLGHNDVDLGPYKAKDRGVSRQHAQIHFRDGELYIEDLNSSNGTTVNGEVLPPGTPAKLRDGDELMLGRMMLWVNF